MPAVSTAHSLKSAGNSRRNSEKMDTNEDDDNDRDGQEVGVGGEGTFVIKAPPPTTPSKYFKQARNQNMVGGGGNTTTMTVNAVTASSNKPIVLSRLQHQHTTEDKVSTPTGRRETTTTTTTMAVNSKSDNAANTAHPQDGGGGVGSHSPQSDQDNRSREIEAEVQSFLKMAEAKKLTVTDNRHFSTFSDFRANGNILDFQRREREEAGAGSGSSHGGGGGMGQRPDAAEDMDWTPSDSKYLKSKRSDISLVGGVSGVSLANEPMDSAPLPHPHAREEGALSRLGGGDGGAEDGEERVGGRGTSTYVMNVMATTSHSQSSTAIASKSKDSVEKKKVSGQLLCFIIMIIIYFLFHVLKLH